MLNRLYNTQCISLNIRRLPIYLLINTSSSICNEAFKNFKDGIKLLIETLQEDSYALETTHISIITFDNTITCLCPLSPLSSFKIPTIKKGEQVASLDQALLQLTTIIDNELIKTTCEQIGDWRPLMFIFTENDFVINITKEVQELIWDKWGRIIICTKTDSVNPENYKKITSVILPIEFLDKQMIKSHIYWISESINACEELDPYNYELELPPHPNLICIDIDSNYSEQNFTYESVCLFTTSSDEVNIKELNTVYEKTVTCLIRQQEQLKSVQSEIDELKKKKNEIVFQLWQRYCKKPRGLIANAVGGFFRGLAGIAGILAGSTSTSSDEAKEKLLECDKELEAKIAQAQMCERHIKGFIQQKDNLEKELAVLEEQNKYNEVYSSIFAPAEVKRKSHLQVQVYLHLYEEAEKVKSLAQESDKTQKEETIYRYHLS